MSEAVRSPRVLVVEDDDSIRGLLVRALCGEALTVDAAADGRQAAVLAGNNDYSLMLIDCMLPGMGSLEFLSGFRKAQPSSSTVVLMMTASDDDVVRGAASDLAHGFIRKPFDLPGLVEVVSAIATHAAACQPFMRPLRDEPWLAC